MNGEYVIFRNHKAYLVNFEQEKEVSSEEIDSLVMHLQCSINLETGTMFKDVWAYVENDWELYSVIFNKSLGRFDLKIYIDQFKKAAKDISEDDPDDSIRYLVITWLGEADKWEDETIALWHAEFGGFGKITEFGGIRETHYGVDFIPINDMKAYELKLDESVGFLYEDFTDKLDTRSKVLFNGVREYSVYDVINAILFEISWHGTPNNQMITHASLDQTISEVKESLRERKREDEDLSENK